MLGKSKITLQFQIFIAGKFTIGENGINYLPPPTFELSIVKRKRKEKIDPFFPTIYEKISSTKFQYK